MLIVILLLLLTGGACVYLFRERHSLLKRLEDTRKTHQRNALKNSRDLEMARRIQSGLLTSDKIQYRNYQISAVCFPAEKIGGDFFILQNQLSNHLEAAEASRKGIIVLKNTKEEALHFLIGDVSGHGVASALVMILAKNILEDLFAEKLSPRRVMHLANRKLIEYTEGSAINFVTAFGATLDPLTGKLTFSKAGHTAPLLFRKSGEIIPLETEGVFLGMFVNPEFEEKEIALEKGDKLFLYTDGVSEARNAQDELLGTQKLIEILRQNIWLSGDALFQKILDDIREYTGGTANSDDITMVLLEVS